MITINRKGRLGNAILLDVCTSILSKKHDLKVINYNNYLNFPFIINLYQGKIIKNNYIVLNESNYEEIFSNDNLDCGILVDVLYQNKKFLTTYQQQIKEHFIFLDNDPVKDEVFLHVRLGDVAYLNPGFDYYDNCLKKINFKKGYISSDSPNHEIVQKLILKYNLVLIEMSPENILNFARKFENLILSNGTFSWWIGFLSCAKNIFYPIMEKKWHGNIYAFENWKGEEI